MEDSLPRCSHSGPLFRASDCLNTPIYELKILQLALLDSVVIFVGFTGIGFGASYYGLEPIVKSYNALQGNNVIFKLLSIVAVIVFTFRGLKPLKRQSITLFLNRDNGERETQNCYLKRSSAGKY
ncbi:hypothetical protein ACFE04_026686 [Oxalis oulophora]